VHAGTGLGRVGVPLNPAAAVTIATFNHITHSLKSMPTPNRSPVPEWRAPASATTRAKTTSREPIAPDVLLDKLENIQRDLRDIADELKDLNASHYLPVPIQPLILSALRQSGFAADHAGTALLVLRATQGKAGQ